MFDHLVFCKSDAEGNRLQCHKNGRLSLVLARDGKLRELGLVQQHPDGNLIYIKHEDAKHVFRKTNAWSITYSILEHVQYVQYVTKEYVYKITAADALAHGDFLWFKTQGFEKKIYVPLEHWWRGRLQYTKQ